MDLLRVHPHKVVILLRARAGAGAAAVAPGARLVKGTGTSEARASVARVASVLVVEQNADAVLGAGAGDIEALEVAVLLVLYLSAGEVAPVLHGRGG